MLIFLYNIIPILLGFFLLLTCTNTNIPKLKFILWVYHTLFKYFCESVKLDK